jgi:ribosomal protein S18 acetylase RimI-like enzyme
MKIMRHIDACPRTQKFIDEGFYSHETGETGVTRILFCLTAHDDMDKLLAAAKGHSCAGALYIKEIIVKQGQRGKGIGRAMMDDIIALAKERNCQTIWVDTLAYQAPAFYEKLGFRESGRVTGYRGPHDRVFYTMQVDGA